MSAELEDNIILSEVFLEILSKEDNLLLKEFLDEQNISDVVELVNEFPEKEGLIIDTMTVLTFLKNYQKLLFVTSLNYWIQRNVKSLYRF